MASVKITTYNVFLVSLLIYSNVVQLKAESESVDKQNKPVESLDNYLDLLTGNTHDGKRDFKFLEGPNSQGNSGEETGNNKVTSNVEESNLKSNEDTGQDNMKSENKNPQKINEVKGVDGDASFRKTPVNKPNGLQETNNNDQQFRSLPNENPTANNPNNPLPPKVDVEATSFTQSIGKSPIQSEPPSTLTYGPVPQGSISRNPMNDIPAGANPPLLDQFPSQPGSKLIHQVPKSPTSINGLPSGANSPVLAKSPETGILPQVPKSQPPIGGIPPADKQLGQSPSTNEVPKGPMNGISPGANSPMLNQSPPSSDNGVVPQSLKSQPPIGGIPPGDNPLIQSPSPTAYGVPKGPMNGIPPGGNPPVLAQSPASSANGVLPQGPKSQPPIGGIPPANNPLVQSPSPSANGVPKGSINGIPPGESPPVLAQSPPSSADGVVPLSPKSQPPIGGIPPGDNLLIQSPSPTANGVPKGHMNGIPPGANPPALAKSPPSSANGILPQDPKSQPPIGGTPLADNPVLQSPTPSPNGVPKGPMNGIPPSVNPPVLAQSPSSSANGLLQQGPKSQPPIGGILPAEDSLEQSPSPSTNGVPKGPMNGIPPGANPPKLAQSPPPSINGVLPQGPKSQPQTAGIPPADNPLVQSPSPSANGVPKGPINGIPLAVDPSGLAQSPPSSVNGVLPQGPKSQPPIAGIPPADNPLIQPPSPSANAVPKVPINGVPLGVDPSGLAQSPPSSVNGVLPHGPKSQPPIAGIPPAENSLVQSPSPSANGVPKGPMNGIPPGANPPVLSQSPPSSVNGVLAQGPKSQPPIVRIPPADNPILQSPSPTANGVPKGPMNGILSDADQFGPARSPPSPENGVLPLGPKSQPPIGGIPFAENPLIQSPSPSANGVPKQPINGIPPGANPPVLAQSPPSSVNGVLTQSPKSEPPIAGIPPADNPLVQSPSPLAKGVLKEPINGVPLGVDPSGLAQSPSSSVNGVIPQGPKSQPPIAGIPPADNSLVQSPFPSANGVPRGSMYGIPPGANPPFPSANGIPKGPINGIPPGANPPVLSQSPPSSVNGVLAQGSKSQPPMIGIPPTDNLLLQSPSPSANGVPKGSMNGIPHGVNPQVLAQSPPDTENSPPIGRIPSTDNSLIQSPSTATNGVLKEPMNGISPGGNPSLLAKSPPSTENGVLPQSPRSQPPIGGISSAVLPVQSPSAYGVPKGSQMSGNPPGSNPLPGGKSAVPQEPNVQPPIDALTVQSLPQLGYGSDSQGVKPSVTNEGTKSLPPPSGMGQSPQVVKSQSPMDGISLAGNPPFQSAPGLVPNSQLPKSAPSINSKSPGVNPPTLIQAPSQAGVNPLDQVPPKSGNGIAPQASKLPPPVNGMPPAGDQSPPLPGYGTPSQLPKSPTQTNGLPPGANPVPSGNEVVPQGPKSPSTIDGISVAGSPLIQSPSSSGHNNELPKSPIVYGQIPGANLPTLVQSPPLPGSGPISQAPKSPQTVDGVPPAGNSLVQSPATTGLGPISQLPKSQTPLNGIPLVANPPTLIQSPSQTVGNHLQTPSQAINGPLLQGPKSQAQLDGNAPPGYPSVQSPSPSNPQVLKSPTSMNGIPLGSNPSAGGSGINPSRLKAQPPVDLTPQAGSPEVQSPSTAGYGLAPQIPKSPTSVNVMPPGVNPPTLVQSPPQTGPVPQVQKSQLPKSPTAMNENPQTGSLPSDNLNGRPYQSDKTPGDGGKSDGGSKTPKKIDTDQNNMGESSNDQPTSEIDLPPGPKVVPVGNLLEPNEMKKLCQLPAPPKGENICFQRNKKDSNSLETWIKICDALANSLGYCQGMCLYIESPIDSQIYYSVCGISKLNSTDASDVNNWVYLTTQDVPVIMPPNTECRNNRFKILHEIQASARNN